MNPMPKAQELREPASPPEPAEQDDEVLVLDARNGLTPRQMVDAKLQAAQGRRPRGVFRRGTGRPGDVDRLRGR